MPRRPRFSSSCSAGNSERLARSPVAPNRTSASLRGFIGRSSAWRPLHVDGVAAERLAQRGDHLHRERVLLPRRETRVERRRDRGSRDTEPDGFLHRPPAFARVVGVPAKRVELGILLERRHEQLEEPRPDDAPLPPRGERRGDVDAELARTEQLVPLGVRLHQAVLDPVVHHLREVPGPRRSAVGEPVRVARGRRTPAARGRRRRRRPPTMRQ